MHLNTLDWSVVAISLVAAWVPSVFFARRASRGTAEFFTSGRAVPWWLAGTSMVATTFATDTPNLITEFVRTSGVAKNWSWWALLLTGMTTVFFYARLWRRSGVLTDLEFYEIRYTGASAAFLRGFRAIYLGLLCNCIIMAIVTLAAVKIAHIMLGWDRWQTIVVCGVICVGFSALSGLWGVLASDLVQFIIAMLGVIGAAYYSLGHPAVGGLDGLVAKIDPARLRLLPDFSDRAIALEIFFVPLCVQWWASWYPGSEPGGGGYVAQRMLAARDERHAVGATLWFNLAHYALRPWPWILVGLCSILVFPTLADIQARFPELDATLIKDDIAYPAMLTLLPHGLIGLLVASLLAAYVSTMSTHLNWGSSYLVNDFYRRFVNRNATERQCVWLSRLLAVGLMLVAILFSTLIESAKDGFDLLMSIGAGTGLVYLLRWFWWRINPWSEIAGMVVSFATAIGLFVANKFLDASIPSYQVILYSVAATTPAWILATFLTAPTPRATLVSFYRLVRPAGPGWRSVRDEAGLPPSPDSLPMGLLGVVLGCTMVWSALFGAGSFLYGNTLHGLIFAVLFTISAVGLWRMLASAWRVSDRA
jgi:Na+/proline symporter